MSHIHCAYIDVDDTLVRSVGTKRIPMPATIAHVKELHLQGVALYCWSAGGGEYAQESAKELGLEHCFKAFLPKPNLMIDDQCASEWPNCTRVHPSELS